MKIDRGEGDRFAVGIVDDAFDRRFARGDEVDTGIAARRVHILLEVVDLVTGIHEAVRTAWHRQRERAIAAGDRGIARFHACGHDADTGQRVSLSIAYDSRDLRRRL